MAAKQPNPRRRPLETCGVSMLAIANIVYKKSQDHNGTLAWTARNLVTSFSPFITAIQSPLLTILFFFDDNLLATEEILETIFPSFNYIFNKVDDVLSKAETAPQKVDDIVKNFGRVSLLNWILLNIISWLSFIVSALSQWRDNNINEKEIRVCKSFGENKGSRKGNEQDCSKKATYREVLQKGTKEDSVDSEKATFKEVLEKAIKEDGADSGKEVVLEKGIKEDGADLKKEVVREEKEIVREEKYSEDSIKRGDPILDLFESGWILSAMNGKGSSNSRKVSPSGSYTQT